MPKIFHDKMRRAREAMKWGMGMLFRDGPLRPRKGLFILEMKDARTGEVLEYWEKENIITLDADILAAILFAGAVTDLPDLNEGVTMLAVGTGATGNILSPDSPQDTQRKLNNEIERKAFSSVQFRNADGVAVAIPTYIVDFTTTFGESEAVGPLNEMGLLSTVSQNPSVKHPIDNGPTDYDPTIDVRGHDILINYLTFSVVSKPSTAILSLTWRITF